jgi:hypothetical protein
MQPLPLVLVAGTRGADRGALVVSAHPHGDDLQWLVGGQLRFSIVCADASALLNTLVGVRHDLEALGWVLRTQLSH